MKNLEYGDYTSVWLTTFSESIRHHFIKEKVQIPIFYIKTKIAIFYIKIKIVMKNVFKNYNEKLLTVM
jgi:hypothetical protein